MQRLRIQPKNIDNPEFLNLQEFSLEAFVINYSLHEIS